MKPTAIASGIKYTPLMGSIEVHLPPKNNDKFYDHWHVEMHEVGDHSPYKTLKGTFTTQEEAKGFMDGWNAHRTAVSETLFINRVKRKK